MSKAVLFFADGTEECEALLVADLLRRAKVEVIIASAMGRRALVSSHGIHLNADALAEDVDYSDVDIVILPGGIPGTPNLAANKTVTDTCVSFAQTGKKVAAICAAPFILGELDLLEGCHATCFPGFEKSFPEGAYTGEKVTQDGNIITASGMAQSLPFALELLRTLAGDKAVEKVAEGIQL